MWRLSGLGDEISPDLDEQIDVLRELGIRNIDVRAVWDRNVMALTPQELATVRDRVASAGMRVLCVASPVGKIEIDAPFAPHIDLFKRALEIANDFAAPYLRIFSFYMPDGDDPRHHRSAVLEHLGTIVQLAAGSGVTLVHENETRIYGDTPARCLDLQRALDPVAFRAIWDPGNYVAVGSRPFDEGYAEMRPYIAGVHVKDALAGAHKAVVAGAGDGQFGETLDALAESGWSGFCSFEPHLAEAGPFGGFSGPEGFRSAVAAFTALLGERGIAWE